jgi:hypothetical protein
MQLDTIRGEIERMRTQVQRQRGEIRQLQQAGISTASADALLEKMLHKIDQLCAERDRLKREHGPVRAESLVVARGDRTSQMVRRERGSFAMD